MSGPRILLWVLALMLVGQVLFVNSATAQTRAELVERLLKSIEARPKIEVKSDDDQLRRLLIERYHVALEEVQQRCADFKNGLDSLDKVIESSRSLLTAELEVLTDTQEKIKALERVIDLVRWYESELEKGLKAGVGLRADMLHTRDSRLTFEIEVLRLKKGLPLSPKR